MSTSANVNVKHTPVMPREIIAALSPCLQRPGAVLVDGTVGMGGHSAALLEACPQARLVGIDRDGDAIAAATERLAPFAGRFSLHRARFDEMGQILDALGIGAVAAVLLDLGLSSLQIDEAHRGFAYTHDGPLDMRMDDRLEVDAAQMVNTWPADSLARVFRDFGEEPHAARVARAIVDVRQQGPIATTAQLAAIVVGAMPAKVRFGAGGHPAKRVFQALRMAVNDELPALNAMLPLALGRLAPGGRLAVLSYHSLDDRLVKQTFRQACEDVAPRGLPVVPDHMKPSFSLVAKGRPQPSEIQCNPRAASARLRVIGALPGTEGGK